MDRHPFHSICSDRCVLPDAARPHANGLAASGSGPGTGILCGCLDPVWRAADQADSFTDISSHRHEHPCTGLFTYRYIASQPDSDENCSIYIDFHLRPLANANPGQPVGDAGYPDCPQEHVHRRAVFHPNRHPHPHPGLDTDSNQSASSYLDCLADANTASHPITYADPIAYADPDTDTDLHPDPDTHAVNSRKFSTCYNPFPWIFEQASLPRS